MELITGWLGANIKYIILIGLLGVLAKLGYDGIWNAGYNAHVIEVFQEQEKKRKAAEEAVKAANARIVENDKATAVTVGIYTGQIKDLQEQLKAEKRKGPTVVRVCKPNPTPGGVPIEEDVEVYIPTEVMTEAPEIDITWKAYEELMGSAQP